MSPLAELVPAVAPVIERGMASTAVALAERVVVIRVERMHARRRFADVVAGIRQLAAELLDLAEALDGQVDDEVVAA